MDLTVSEDNLAKAIEEAETLPSVEITKLDCQWLQVPHFGVSVIPINI